MPRPALSGKQEDTSIYRTERYLQRTFLSTQNIKVTLDPQLPFHYGRGSLHVVIRVFLELIFFLQIYQKCQKILSISVRFLLLISLKTHECCNSAHRRNISFNCEQCYLSELVVASVSYCEKLGCGCRKHLFDWYALKFNFNDLVTSGNITSTGKLNWLQLSN